jgi:hypothetical protein
MLSGICVLFSIIRITTFCLSSESYSYDYNKFLFNFLFFAIHCSLRRGGAHGFLARSLMELEELRRVCFFATNSANFHEFFFTMCFRCWSFALLTGY